jgi:L,D-peptidoglycan transpeptidase YkuD (ErfK/YbiS/YcfS/YnhG family)
MNLIVSAGGQARFGNAIYRCAIGRGGIRSEKTEGDGASPAGCFKLLGVRYRKERIRAPETALIVDPLSRSNGWCDAPQDPAYNQAVTLPYPASCENLYRNDGLYDIVVITSHNSNPVVPGAGSAIFVHVVEAPDYPPTGGCIAFTLDDLREILARWKPETDCLIIR